eukprot:m.42158 g.42158  ORF g.42158 m.42158 type:complete len:809 (-) comp8290_c0_seq1:120-2546(-)
MARGRRPPRGTELAAVLFAAVASADPPTIAASADGISSHLQPHLNSSLNLGTTLSQDPHRAAGQPAPMQWHGLAGLRRSRQDLSSCTAVEACVANASCHSCLTQLYPFAINAVQSNPEQHLLETGFYHALDSTPACSVAAEAVANATLALTVKLHRTAPCGSREFLLCQSMEAECFSDPHCRVCLTGLYSAPPQPKRQVLAWAACNSSMLRIRQLGQWCTSMPSCTIYKELCSGACAGCMETLRGGNPAEAARQCASPVDLRDNMTNVVYHCSGGNALTCGYFIAQCGLDPACTACLESMDGFKDAGTTLAAIGSPVCQRLLANASAPQNFFMVDNIFSTCPPEVVPTCTRTMYYCLVDPRCAVCINGTTSQSTPACVAELERSGVTSSCAPCPSTVSEINAVVIATAVVGGLSVLACFATVLVIVAYARERELAEGCVLGLALANAVYSSANAIPINLYHTDIVRCGAFVLSFDTIRFGRAWWFAGKYAVVCYEICVLLVSVWLLKKGVTTLSRRTMGTVHALCVVGGVAAFAGFYIQCQGINDAGYNAATLAIAETNHFEHFSSDDAVDDDDPQHAAAATYTDQRARYDSLVQVMLQVWAGLLGVAIALWVNLRWVFLSLVRAWQGMLAVSREQWGRDYWDGNPAMETKATLLRLSKDAYDDVAKPLEPYVFVFVLFGVPACVMATDFCRNASGASSGATSLGFTSLAVSYGTCDVWCEFALAFRSLATVCVYFASRDRRHELWAGRALCRRLGGRIRNGIWGNDRKGRVRFAFREQEMVRMIAADPRDYVEFDERTCEQPAEQTM